MSDTKAIENKPNAAVTKKEEETEEKTESSTINFTYGGVLVAAVHPESKEVVVLLGQEGHNPGWSESDKWSDFGGGPKKSDTNILVTARRELQGETLGLFGTDKWIDENLMQTGQHFVLDSLPTSNKDKKESVYAHVSIVRVAYDPGLSNAYNNIYQFLQTACSVQHPRWKHFKHIPTCEEGTMEKVKLGWHSLSMILSDTSRYRASFLHSLTQLIDLGIF